MMQQSHVHLFEIGIVDLLSPNEQLVEVVWVYHAGAIIRVSIWEFLEWPQKGNEKLLGLIYILKRPKIYPLVYNWVSY